MALNPLDSQRLTPVARILSEAEDLGTVKDAQAPLAPAGDRLDAGALSQGARRQMRAIQGAAEDIAGGRRPNSRCYEKVWAMICQNGYGKMPGADIPGAYSTYAKQFAQYADQHLDELGLKKLPVHNPYDAPAGSLVVVRPGTPGTSHPTAGDIVVAMGNGRFLNDGEMGYGGPECFAPGNDYVLGVYAPA